jgi:hypothetical protein
MSKRAGNQTLELLREKIRSEMNDIADHMAGGGCNNIDEYRFSTGKINGLDWVERELLDLDERLSKE